jgi:hypothetical protein
MTPIRNKVRRQSQFVRWIQAGAVAGTIMTAVVAIMILAVSNSAQSAQARVSRAEGAELRMLERHLLWGGSHEGYELLL